MIDGRVCELGLDALRAQAPRDAIEEQPRDGVELLTLQRAEDDDLVDSVQELRAEAVPQELHQLILELLEGLVAAGAYGRRRTVSVSWPVKSGRILAMGEPEPGAFLREFRPAYPIETERLLVRPYTDDDFDALYAMHSRADVTRYVPWKTRDAEATRRALQRKVEHTALADGGDAIGLAVVLREEGSVIGDLSLMWISREHADGEIGFLFHPDHQGRGYALEASRVLLELGFRELGLHRLTGRVDARNAPSIRLMEKLGMRREAHLVENEWVKGEWQSERVYALLEHEWRAGSGEGAATTG